MSSLKTIVLAAAVAVTSTAAFAAGNHFKQVESYGAKPGSTVDVRSTDQRVLTMNDQEELRTSIYATFRGNRDTAVPSAAGAFSSFSFR